MDCLTRRKIPQPQQVKVEAIVDIAAISRATALCHELVIAELFEMVRYQVHRLVEQANEFIDPMVYSYASPRTGDGAFAAAYNHVVKRTCRIANRLDLVPKLPLPPLYEHVTGVYDLNPVILGLPPRILVKPDLVCEHILTTYLHLLTHQAGGTILPLEAKCVPP